MFVGCKLPAGHTVDHNNQVIVLNGANIGYDGDHPWSNGAAPDSALRASGVGLTEVTGAQADALADWIALSGKGPGPVQAGMIFVVDKRVDAVKEAQSIEGEKTGLDGIDPAKDLPAGLSTDPDAKA